MKLLKSQNGWAMPLAIMIVAVAALLSVALYQYAVSDNLQVQKDEDRQKAKYLARSGLEAVIKAWKDADNEIVSDTAETVYLMKDGSYKLSGDLTEEQKNNETTGKVDVTVNKITEPLDPEAGCTKFVATAVVNGITQKVTVTSSPYMKGQDLDWYDYVTGEIKTSANPANEKNVTVDGEQYTVSYHDPSGVVECRLSGNNAEFRPKLDNTQNRVAYIGQSMYFYNPVNMSTNSAGNYQSALVLSAPVVDFKKRVDLRLSVILENGNVVLDKEKGYGTVVLHVPKQLGIKLPDRAGEYGLVYFEGGVNITYHQKITFLGFTLYETEGTMTDVYPNRMYYFKRLEDSSGEDVGLNLLEWYTGSNENMIPIGSTDVNAVPPYPRDQLKFVWNW